MASKSEEYRARIAQQWPQCPPSCRRARGLDTARRGRKARQQGRSPAARRAASSRPRNAMRSESWSHDHLDVVAGVHGHLVADELCLRPDPGFAHGGAQLPQSRATPAHAVRLGSEQASLDSSCLTCWEQRNSRCAARTTAHGPQRRLVAPTQSFPSRRSTGLVVEIAKTTFMTPSTTDDAPMRQGTRQFKQAIPTD